MQDQKPNTEAKTTENAKDASAAVLPPVQVSGVNLKAAVTQEVYVRKIVEKIRNADNILVALSRDPSVDEITAALGLAMFLDSIQKHTTAIYSGQTPDALQFLQPEGTFETNTDSLRDFIIALSKDKADHLRYKLEGDFVKVYITPYKTTITEQDLEFSYSDFSVDLVLALGVPSAGDLDAALAEYGRIMHDATTVDITIDAPGKFGEIEWSDPTASSVSAMVTKLIFALQGPDTVLDQEIATALLTGIVAATGRFSNDRTNPHTMQLASKLMAMGADQQLISANVMDNNGNVAGEYDYNAYPAYGGGYQNDAPATQPVMTEVELGQGTNAEMGAPQETNNGVEQPEMAAPETEVKPAEMAAPAVTPLPPVLKPEPEDPVVAAEKAMQAVNEAVNKALETAEAVGAQGVGLGNQAKNESSNKPVIPKAETKVETPKLVNEPKEETPKVEMPQAETPQPIQPIAPAKDYGQMIDQALAEAGVGGTTPVQGGAQPIVVTPPQPLVTPPVVEPSIVEPSIVEPAGIESTAPTTPISAPQFEQVDKPAGVPLPPPPAPTVGAEMMPPVLPPTPRA